MKADLLITGIYLLMGWLLGFFGKKLINVGIFVVLVFAGMTALEELGMLLSWSAFDDLKNSLFGTGSATYNLFKSFLTGTSALLATAFLVGGVSGLLTSSLNKG